MPSRAGMECRPFARSNSVSCKAYRMSKPNSQQTTAPPSQSAGGSIRPVTAIHAPTGATARAKPRKKCEKAVKRLV